MKRNMVLGVMGVSMAAMLFAAGCKKKEAAEPESRLVVETQKETQAQTEAKETKETLPEGEMYSYLTGEPVSKEVGTKRPYAVMINNITDAIPQSGISQADIMYECLVESGITRLMAVIQDTDDLNKLGPIRSARHYFIDFAKDDDAIFTHFGQSIFAEAKIAEEDLTTISGLSSYSEDVFYRSDDRVAPHNVYTTGDGLAAGVVDTSQTRDYPEGYETRFLFNTTDTPLTTGDTANKVTLPFPDYSNPWFEYNSDDGLYYRFQYGEAHIDVENDEQLSFKNIIVVYSERSVISEQDHQDYNLYGDYEGDGLYITDGKAVKIHWKKANTNDQTKYYLEDGTQLVMNQGKTFIACVPTGLTAEVLSE